MRCSVRAARARWIVAQPLAARFRDLDFATEEGQAAARSALQELFTQFDTGFFTQNFEQLGALTRDEFLDFLQQGADALEELAGVTNEAVSAMLNVPTGFRLAAARFAAQVPGGTSFTIPPHWAA